MYLPVLTRYTILRVIITPTKTGSTNSSNLTHYHTILLRDEALSLGSPVVLRSTPTGTMTVGGAAASPTICAYGDTVEQYSAGLLGFGLRGSGWFASSLVGGAAVLAGAIGGSEGALSDTGV